mmetsp:Transcript_84449/g.262187  ORF Transcript_84449/g.262187 Transcript_84449/m.262187 type:complete len:277 (-) Transcript_84449:171-1001(-)|eukprot:CAMPEP_0204597098 /NCGR_PEP_ID=MMETSP0661-20131031/53617_1 /ASSEMBLY_ACC=CAM_ASM_000606 /TAXON_ID=109239 /ORGANISM="Alexandrium margalefi, Strain AMGDE01CS-322" /LENGTH=276 /DNA_ID=CAMNT_0051607771 /DNA_START=55 /DNA_END=885 /DNA_ORIENTATION=-
MPSAPSPAAASWEADTQEDDSDFEVIEHGDIKAQAFDEVSTPPSEDERGWQFLDTESQVSLPLSQAGEDKEEDVLSSTAESFVAESLEEEPEEHGLATTEPDAAEQPEAVRGDQEKLEAATPPGAAAAALLATAPLHLGSNLLAECEGFRRDATKQWAAALEGFPRMAGAFCLGRLLVLPGQCPGGVQAVARAVVINNGRAAWPAATAVRIVAGDAYGFGAMHVGALEPGQGADLALDLVLPTDAEPCSGKRSAWVLTDDHGEPFGPLLVLEVAWA